MYGLQTAPSPRRTNCPRNIHFGNQHHACSSNFGWKLWNSHNSNFSQLKFCHSISYTFLVFSYNSNPLPLPLPSPPPSPSSLPLVSPLPSSGFFMSITFVLRNTRHNHPEGSNWNLFHSDGSCLCLILRCTFRIIFIVIRYAATITLKSFYDEALLKIAFKHCYDELQCSWCEVLIALAGRMAYPILS